MIGLPKETEMSKQLPKKAIYAKFKMDTAEKKRLYGTLYGSNPLKKADLPFI